MNKLAVNNTKDPAYLSGAAVSSKAAAHKLDSVTSSTNINSNAQLFIKMFSQIWL